MGVDHQGVTESLLLALGMVVCAHAIQLAVII